MLMERTGVTSQQSVDYDLDSRLDTVKEMIKIHDGSPVSKSLIRRAVLRSLFHLPHNHNANEALELFYDALDQATITEAGRKSRSKAPSVASLLKIWVEARKAIETVTAKFVSSSGSAMR